MTGDARACLKCGYDLSGIGADLCPECGASQYETWVRLERIRTQRRDGGGVAIAILVLVTSLAVFVTRVRNGYLHGTSPEEQTALILAAIALAWIVIGLMFMVRRLARAGDRTDAPRGHPVLEILVPVVLLVVALLAGLAERRY